MPHVCLHCSVSFPVAHRPGDRRYTVLSIRVIITPIDSAAPSIVAPFRIPSRILPRRVAPFTRPRPRSSLRTKSLLPLHAPYSRHLLPSRSVRDQRSIPPAHSAGLVVHRGTATRRLWQRAIRSEGRRLEASLESPWIQIVTPSSPLQSTERALSCLRDICK